MSRKTSSKQVHKIKKLARPRLVLYLAIITGLLTIGSWYWQNIYEPDHLPGATYNYQNLDLALASKATYTNSAVSIARKLNNLGKIRQQLISFNVPKDNLKEFALMTLPVTAPAKGGYPVIILCHGYTNPQDYSTLDAYMSDMEFYSQHGFAVIKPDYRGQGFSLTAGTPDGAYYSMSYNTDVMSLMAAIKHTSYLNYKQMSLFGQSMGGYIALRAAVLSPEVKNLILLSAPVGNVQDMFSKYTAVSDSANPVAANVRDDQLTAHGTPLNNPAFWDKTSPLDYLDRLKAYTQIYVGVKDKVVPPEFSAELNSALHRAGKPHSYTVYANGDHGLVDQRTDIWPKSLSLLNK